MKKNNFKSKIIKKTDSKKQQEQTQKRRSAQIVKFPYQKLKKHQNSKLAFDESSIKSERIESQKCKIIDFPLNKISSESKASKRNKKNITSKSESKSVKKQLADIVSLPSSQNFKERRQSERFEIQKSLCCYVVLSGSLGGLFKVILEDLSLKGCRFSSRYEFGLGESLAFRLYLGSKAYLPFTAEIITQYNEEKNMLVYGAEIKNSSTSFKDFVGILSVLFLDQGDLLISSEMA